MSPNNFYLTVCKCDFLTADTKLSAPVAVLWGIRVFSLSRVIASPATTPSTPTYVESTMFSEVGILWWEEHQRENNRSTGFDCSVLPRSELEREEVTFSTLWPCTIQHKAVPIKFHTHQTHTNINHTVCMNQLSGSCLISACVFCYSETWRALLESC